MTDRETDRLFIGTAFSGMHRGGNMHQAAKI
jgi:hypothetical protein